MYTIEYPWPRPLLSANDRMHWAEKSRLTKTIRQMTGLKARGFPKMGRCEVQLVWTVKDNRRRDEDNTYPTFKAACDGLVDAGIVPDDTPAYMVKLAPTIVHGEKASVALTVRDVTS